MKLHIHLSPENTELVIDGLDISKMVLRQGFSITLDPDHPRPLVTMQMRAASVKVDGQEVDLNVQLPEGVAPDEWVESLRKLVERKVSTALGGVR